MIINVIGDITGYGDTLEVFYPKLPEGQLWSLGDIVDRGPNSKKALDFLIDGKHNAVMGNHDHMMLFEKIQNREEVDWTLYDPGIWAYNGGDSTAQSFGYEDASKFRWFEVDDKYFQFIEKSPLIKYFDNVLQLSHAPLMNNFDSSLYDINKCNSDGYKMRESTLWNRYPPKLIENMFQVYGHNSTRGILWHTYKHPQGIYCEVVPDDAWGACIDTWREGYLTVLSIDTELLELEKPKEAIQIFTHEIIDPGVVLRKSEKPFLPKKGLWE